MVREVARGGNSSEPAKYCLQVQTGADMLVGSSVDAPVPDHLAILVPARPFWPDEHDAPRTEAVDVRRGIALPETTTVQREADLLVHAALRP